jgi:hypothetical protein
MHCILKRPGVKEALKHIEAVEQIDSTVSNSPLGGVYLKKAEQEVYNVTGIAVYMLNLGFSTSPPSSECSTHLRQDKEKERVQAWIKSISRNDRTDQKVYTNMLASIELTITPLQKNQNKPAATHLKMTCSL